MAKRILVVEDDKSLREMFQSMLSNAGYEIVPAENGRVALDRCRARVPDLILLDLLMPEMDGYEFLREFRTQGAWQRVPVIVLTALDHTENEKMARDLGADDFLRKDQLHLHELLTLVERYVTTGRPATPA